MKPEFRLNGLNKHGGLLIRISFHILVWIFFLFLLHSLIPTPESKFKTIYLFADIIYISIFYLHFFYFIPKFFLSHKYIHYALVFTIGLVLMMFMPLINDFSKTDRPVNINNKETKPPKNELSNFEPQPPMFFNPNEKPIFPVNENGGQIKPYRLLFTTYSYILIVYLFLIFVAIGVKVTERLNLAEKEKSVAELAFLKMQINPHFLFNTLNSIYSMAIVQSDKTAEAVEKFANIMRFVIDDTKENMVRLDKKMEYLSDYIDLQKLRMPSNVKVNFSVTGKSAGLKIAPMVLLPFVENAFKYGHSTEHESEIFINIAIQGKELHLLVHNTCFKKQANKVETFHIGIENTYKRIELLYPGKHMLSINETETDFNVSLHLNLEQ
jgi:hypothetical protein